MKQLKDFDKDLLLDFIGWFFNGREKRLNQAREEYLAYKRGE